MRRNKLAIGLLVFTLVAAAGVRIVGTTQKFTITHDEGFSYVFATCHGGEWTKVVKGRLYPYGRWVPASEWKRFTSLERTSCFRQIGSDLAHYDIHPPLYFWLLHAWSLLVGVHVWTGPLLNTLLSLLATLCLFGLARRALRHSMEAAVVTFAWAMSPAAIIASLEARQYSLLALVTVAFVWQAVRYADLTKQPKLLGFVALAAITAAGALTHYHFPLVVVTGTSLFLIVRLIKRDRSRLIAALGSIAVGHLIFLALHPQFYLSFMVQQTGAGAFETAGVPERISRVGATFMGLFLPFETIEALSNYARLTLIAASVAWLIILYLSLAFLGWLFLVYLKDWLRFTDYVCRVDWKGSYVLYFFAWITGATVLLYLSFVSNEHAMGQRYLSAAWPFYAFVPVFVLRFWRKVRVPVVGFLSFGLLLFAATVAAQGYYLSIRPSQPPDPSVLLRRANAVLVDHDSKGVLPPIFWHVPDDKPMFVARPTHLLNHPGRWRSRLRSPSIYVSDLSYANTEQQRRRILEAARREYRVAPLGGGIWGAGEVFELEKEP